MARDWIEYVGTISGHMSHSDISKQIGIAQSAFSKWMRGGGVDALTAIKFARHFGRPPLEALVVIGALTDDEAMVGVPSGEASLATMSSFDLLEELYRREIAKKQSTAATAGTADNRALDEL